MDNTTFNRTFDGSLNPNFNYIGDFVVYIVIGCLGILDNGFVIIVILHSRKMRNKLCNLFILNQSVVDLVASVFLLCNSPSVPTLGSASNISLEFYCRIWDSNYLFWAAVTWSTYNLVAITIERYLEVVHPLRYRSFFTRRRAKVIVAVVWLVGFTIPIVTSVITSPAGADGTCQKHRAWSSRLMAALVGFYALFFGFLLPVVIMIVCYTQMIMTFNLKVRPSDPSTMISESEKRRSERMLRVRKSLIKTMLMVSIVFVICWIGDQVYFFLFNIRVIKDLQQTLTTIVVSLAFLNCCINPFIYTCQYNDFQEATRRLLKIKKESENSERSTLDLSNQKV
uniref:G protein coupled receptor n=1 Tax=Perinereis aibuhitensis TaxID=126650 RepID=A0A1S6KJN5_PERAI|nr:G protein coupled receptor [Perinereis aibuhitensis]